MQVNEHQNLGVVKRRIKSEDFSNNENFKINNNNRIGDFILGNSNR